MSGGDVLSEPPGVPLLGQSEVGATDYDWEHAKLKERLRNNRMPPGWEFDITEENRDGPMVCSWATCRRLRGMQLLPHQLRRPRVRANAKSRPFP